MKPPIRMALVILALVVLWTLGASLYTVD